MKYISKLTLNTTLTTLITFFMKAFKILSWLFAILFSCNLFSQNNKVVKPVFVFGKINAEDFAPKFYSVDSNASAIVLADVGSSIFEGNQRGDFSIVYKRFERIRLLNKKGFENATFEFHLNKKGNIEENLENLEAVTYNIDGGSVVPTKLEKSEIFKSSVTKDYQTVKFTMPNIREGSIIECRYTIKTPFYQFLRSWNFQGEMPRLWSEYTISVPKIFDYVLLNYGLYKYDVDDSKITNEGFNIIDPGKSGLDATQVFSIRSDVFNRTWGVKNLPSLKREPFTTSIDNYSQKIEFQLRRIIYSDNNIIQELGTWSSFSKALLESEYFGKDLDKNAGFASEVNVELKGVSDNKKRAIIIYNYIKNNFTYTDEESYLMDNTFRKIYNSKKGNAAEINLLLINILRSNGFTADPVILSTAENGKANEIYPMQRKFNYVICRVVIDEKPYLLDATDNNIGFGILAPNKFNGSGRIIKGDTKLIPMSPDSLMESKLTSIFVFNSDDNKGLTGTYKSTYGTYGSISARKLIKKEGKQSFFKGLTNHMPSDYMVSLPEVDSLNELENPITVRYNFDLKPEGDILYFNPMMNELKNENPFKSAERFYPVEMPFKQNDTYLFNMDTPAGYQIDELPKSEKIKLENNDGFYEYIIGKTEGGIQLRSRLVLNKTFFVPDDYQTLRDFYSMIVKKQSSLIVFKKTK